ncbi:MAG: hypothetical protein ABSH06_31720 [Thermodesulfobacteriota bacterium]|jgi:hypothetical protein
MSEYKKICYWVDFQGLKNVRENLEEKEIKLPEEARIPCRVLRTSMEVGYVVPLAWEGFCKRRTSWYLSSEKAGKFMVVSNRPLNVSGLKNPILIMNSNFIPDRLPTSSETAELAQSVSFQSKKPQIWDKSHPLEKEFYQRWFERYQAKEPFDFDEILLGHSANHANFIEPKFFNDLNGSKIPYSIANSTHVCSSCLEFFNILGSQWPVKHVVPCIGAVQFAKLPIDDYFKVVTSGEI